MALTRFYNLDVPTWSPFRQLSVLRDEIDNLFESPLRAMTATPQQFMGGWMPAVDLHEDSQQLTLHAELPGMKREDISISLHGDLLTISGERKEDEDLAKAQVFRSERWLGKFQRTFTLPTLVAVDKVQASYKDGILTVVLPKADEAKPKQIDVSVE